MLRNDNGFTLIEVLVATSLLFLTLSFILPSFVILHSERQSLYREIEIVQQLEQKLHDASLESERIPFQISEEISGRFITYIFTIDDQLIKGCAHWETEKTDETSMCLYKKKRSI